MCCGKNRAQFRGRTPDLQPPSHAQATSQGPQPQLGRYSGSTFEYIGGTRLTVAGSVTGREYRFDRPGARIEVDPRDTPSIAVIPLLRALEHLPHHLERQTSARIWRSGAGVVHKQLSRTER